MGFHRPAGVSEESCRIFRHFCGLVFVYCLNRVTGLSLHHFYHIYGISNSQSQNKHSNWCCFYN
jgi:hypothetical protein